MHRRTVIAVALLVTAGCDDSKSSETSAAVEAAKETAKAAETVKEAGKALKEHASGDEKKGFEFTITGYDAPDVTGSSVMASTMPGGVARYTFVTMQGSASLSLENAKKHQTGTFDPYNFSIMLRDEQVSCGYSSIDEKGGTLEVKIEKKGDGIGGTIDGDVTCSPLQGGDRKQAKIKGWFEDS